MKKKVKITKILDAKKAIDYGFSKKAISDCIGKVIYPEIDGVHLLGEKVIINWFLPTPDSLRHGQKICQMEVEIL